jgi:protein gp37
MVFVNSMSDLFHESVPDEFIEKVFDVIGKCPQHIFQILTKRHERLQTWSLAAFPNVWVGVSCENQETLDKRVPALLATPAIVRWVSLEPLLSRVNFRWAHWEPLKRDAPTDELDGLRRLNWVVIGGESGLLKDVRPFNIDWAREIIRQCKQAGVPVFMKQIGSHAVKTDISTRYKTLHKKGGNPDEWPEDLRVREYPV